MSAPTLTEDTLLCQWLYDNGYVGEQNVVNMNALEQLVKFEDAVTRSPGELFARVHQVLGVYLRQQQPDRPLDLTFLQLIHSGGYSEAEPEWTREMDHLVCRMAMDQGVMFVSGRPYGGRLTQALVHRKRSTKGRARARGGALYALLDAHSDYSICRRYNNVLRFLLKPNLSNAENSNWNWLLHMHSSEMVERFDGGDEQYASEEYTVHSEEEREPTTRRKRKKAKVEVDTINISMVIKNNSAVAHARRIEKTNALILRGVADTKDRSAVHDVSFTRLYNFLNSLDPIVPSADRNNVMGVFTKRSWVLLRKSTSDYHLEQFDKFDELHAEVCHVVSSLLSTVILSKIVHLISGWPEHDCLYEIRSLRDQRIHEEVEELEVDDLVVMLESLVTESPELAKIMNARRLPTPVPMSYVNDLIEGDKETENIFSLDPNEYWESDSPNSWEERPVNVSEESREGQMYPVETRQLQVLYQPLAIASNPDKLYENVSELIEQLEGRVSELTEEMEVSLSEGYDDTPPDQSDPVYYRRDLGDFSLIVWNPVDNEEFEDFFLLKSLPSIDKDQVSAFMLNCECKGDCFESKSCFCVNENLDVRLKLPYTGDGMLSDRPDMTSAAITGDRSPRLYCVLRSYPSECNERCSCSATCGLRKVQHTSAAFDIQVFRTTCKGWGIRTLEMIEAGSYVVEYLGEIVDQRTAHELGIGYDIEKCSYLFDLDAHSVKSQDEHDRTEVIDQNVLYTIDAKKRGGIARFINHSCDPNLKIVPVMWDHVDVKKPHVAFFAIKDILPYEELSFNYKYEIDPGNWSESFVPTSPYPLQDLPFEDQILCRCGSSSCIGRIW